MRLKRRVDRRAQEGVDLRRGERKVGRDDREHRGEPGVDHSRALRHPADGEPVARDGALLRPAVGREDRLRSGSASFRPERGGRSAHSGEHLLERERNPDHAGREDDDLLRAKVEHRRRLGRRALRVGDSALARGRVRDARVHHDGLRLRELEMPARDDDGRGLHTVRRPYRRANRWRHRADEREVARRASDPGLDPACDESTSRRHGHDSDQHPGESQAGGLLEAEEEVDVLHRLAGSALAEVVEGADDDRACRSSDRRTPRSPRRRSAGRARAPARRLRATRSRRGCRRSAPRAERAGRRRRSARSTSRSAPSAPATGAGRTRPESRAPRRSRARAGDCRRCRGRRSRARLPRASWPAASGLPPSCPTSRRRRRLRALSSPRIGERASSAAVA